MTTETETSRDGDEDGAGDDGDKSRLSRDGAGDEKETVKDVGQYTRGVKIIIRALRRGRRSSILGSKAVLKTILCPGWPC